ncbi:MAG: BolA family transcriptional regulator [Bdellovibrionaceae bacterium]|nr:BolA family transcriptional regulator [Pseudobdellovibrionaceae bacterium]
MKPIEAEIIRILEKEFAPSVLEVVNESDMHHGPKGRESHFKVYLVSDSFSDMSRIQRQRIVFAALGDIMTSIHAFTLKAVTRSEHQSQASGFESPKCASASHKKLL